MIDDAIGTIACLQGGNVYRQVRLELARGACVIVEAPASAPGIAGLVKLDDAAATRDVMDDIAQVCTRGAHQKALTGKLGDGISQRMPFASVHERGPEAGDICRIETIA